MATTYNINYDDQRFKDVETQKQAAVTEINDTYNNMIDQSDQFYDDQIKAAQDYARTQQQIQKQQTDFAVEQINQQKDKAHKDYIKEQSGAYVDWQKQSNQYGANAEQMAAQGMSNTGYSESSQVSMFNTYQNRISTARETYNNAVISYDNAIKDARLQNSAKLAEIAYQALQTQLEMSLEGFQYKNSLIDKQLQAQQDIEDRYYSRWQDVLAQMNTENALAEQIRQFNEGLAEDRRQFDTTMDFNEKEFAEMVRQFGLTYGLSEKELAESIRQFNLEYELEKKNLNKSSRGKSGSGGGGSNNISTGSPKITKTKSNGVKSSKGHHSSAIARKNAKK